MSKFAFCLIALMLVSSLAAKSVKVNLTRKTVQRKRSALSFLASDPEKNVSNVSNTIYIGEIGFGKDATNGIQKLPLIFDTGSSWLWGAETGCNCPFISSSDPTFTPSHADSWVNLGITENLAYGAGATTGVLGTIDIYFTDDVVVKGQHIIAAKEGNSFGTDAPFSGIMGLGRPIGSGGYNSIIFQMAANGIIEKNMFTLALFGENDQSYITVGEVDDANTIDEFMYTDLVLQFPYTYYYTINLPEFNLGGGNTITNQIAIVDSGTSGIVIPEFAYEEWLQNSVSKSKCYNFQQGIIACPCTDNGLSPVSVTIGNRQWTFTDEDLVLPLEQGICQLAIESVPDAPGIVLGDPFMRKVVVVFDNANGQIGFATNKYSQKPKNINSA